MEIKPRTTESVVVRAVLGSVACPDAMIAGRFPHGQLVIAGRTRGSPPQRLRIWRTPPACRQGASVAGGWPPTGSAAPRQAQHRADRHRHVNFHRGPRGAARQDRRSAWPLTYSSLSSFGSGIWAAGSARAHDAGADEALPRPQPGQVRSPGQLRPIRTTRPNWASHLALSTLLSSCSTARTDWTSHLPVANRP